MAAYKIIIRHKSKVRATFIIVATSRANAKFQLEAHSDYIEHVKQHPSPIEDISLAAQLGQRPAKTGLIDFRAPNVRTAHEEEA